MKPSKRKKKGGGGRDGQEETNEKINQSLTLRFFKALSISSLQQQIVKG